MANEHLKDVPLWIYSMVENKGTKFNIRVLASLYYMKDFLPDLCKFISIVHAIQVNNLASNWRFTDHDYDIETNIHAPGRLEMCICRFRDQHDIYLVTVPRWNRITWNGFHCQKSMFMRREFSLSNPPILSLSMWVLKAIEIKSWPTQY